MAERYDQELLLGYVEGELTSEEAAELERVLAEDVGLRQLVESLRADRAALGSLPEAEPPPHLADEAVQHLERRMLLGEPAEPAEQMRRQEQAGGSRLRLGRWAAYGGVAAAILISSGVILQTLFNISPFDAVEQVDELVQRYERMPAEQQQQQADQPDQPPSPTAEPETAPPPPPPPRTLAMEDTDEPAEAMEPAAAPLSEPLALRQRGLALEPEPQRETLGLRSSPEMLIGRGRVLLHEPVIAEALPPAVHVELSLPAGDPQAARQRLARLALARGWGFELQPPGRDMLASEADGSARLHVRLRQPALGRAVRELRGHASAMLQPIELRLSPIGRVTLPQPPASPSMRIHAIDPKAEGTYLLSVRFYPS